MPLYEWQCSDDACGDLTETVVPISERHNAPPCPQCKGPMHRVMLPSNVRATHCDAILIFQAADGTYKFPGRNDAPTPEGCTRLELQPVDARRVLRQASRREQELAERYNEAEIQAYEIAQKHNRSELFNQMANGGVAEYMLPDRTIVRRSFQFTDRMRDFARMAMDYANSRPIRKAPDAELHIEALEYNAGNREGWSDRDRNGRRRK